MYEISPRKPNSYTAEMTTKPTTRTLDQFLTELGDQDMSISDWAKQKGFSLSSVYQVTRERTVGHRGEARKIARAMGLPLPTKQASKKAA